MDCLRNLKEIPYWLDPAPPTGRLGGDPPPPRTDTLIVGSGGTGVSAAIALRKAGLAVTVLDRESLGCLASARNGGMVLTGLNEGLSSLIGRYGLETARGLFRESLESVATVERLVREFDIDCSFHHYGCLETAFKPSHADHLKAERDLLAEKLGHEKLFIPRADLHSELGSDLYYGGLVDPLSAGYQPGRYIAGLIEAAHSLGVSLHSRTEALDISRRGSGFTVTTNRGAIEADEVIVATNGYTGRLTPWLQRRVVPAESLMIATGELDPDLAHSLIPNGRMVFDTKIFLYYFRLSPDGRRMLFGGRPKWPPRPLRENALFMRSHMLKVFPRLKDVSIDYVWSGNVAVTRDSSPHLGRRGGIHYGLGYCGHGAAFASYFGERLADMVLGRGSNTLFAELPFPGIPLYGGRPWFKPLLHAYFSAIDRFGR